MRALVSELISFKFVLRASSFSPLHLPPFSLPSFLWRHVECSRHKLLMRPRKFTWNFFALLPGIRVFLLFRSYGIKKDCGVAELVNIHLFMTDTHFIVWYVYIDISHQTLCVEGFKRELDSLKISFCIFFSQLWSKFCDYDCCLLDASWCIVSLFRQRWKRT